MVVDIGSSNITCLIAEVIDGTPRIIGSGISKSQGIRKGIITYIEQAAHSIKSAIDEAKMMAGVEINKAIISVSGGYAKSRNSSCIISVTGGEIGINEIRRAVKGALHLATIPSEYEVIHILPYQFVIDEQDCVDDPNGMSGSRLKTNVRIVTLQKTILDNLRKVTKFIGLEIENIVLSSYASSIAVLNDDEKELGVACIDMGGSTCDVMIYHGSSLCYDEVLKVGSNNITNDIALVFNTPMTAAEDIKIQYGNILDFTDHKNQKVLEIPVVGSHDKMQTITCGELAKVIYYRLAETFNFLHTIVERNDLCPQIGAGVVFTGGLMNLRGIEDFIEAFFKDFPTRVALPKEIEGLPDNMKGPEFSTAIGLVLYGSGNFTNYEIDSEKRLKTKKSRLFMVEDNDTTKQNDKEDIASVFDDEMPKKENQQESPKKTWWKQFVDKYL